MAVSENDLNESCVRIDGLQNEDEKSSMDEFDLTATGTGDAKSRMYGKELFK